MFSSTAQRTVAAAHQPEYEHTQWAPMFLLLLMPGIVLLVVAAITGDDEAALICLATSAFLVGMANCFCNMRVYDNGDDLAIRYGPLPVFRKRIPYREIVAAEPDKSSIVDGWGMHWVPGRGWTYNLWGFDCIRLSLTRGRTIRIGTDDPNGLAQFVRRKIGADVIRPSLGERAAV